MAALGRLLRRYPLLRFFLRRVAALFLLAIGITLVAFLLTNLVPANPAAANLGEAAATDPAAVAAYNHRYGLDRPLPIRYLTYVERLVQGDLGTSQHTQQPVLSDLRTYVPATIELALFAILIGGIVGITAGVVAAMTRNRLPDQVLRVLALVGISMPSFWIGLLALYLFFFKLGWLPNGGRLDPGASAPAQITGLYTVDALLHGQWHTFIDALRHLILPGLVLATFSVALLTRYSRSAVLEVIGKDYVRSARAKGLRSRSVIVGHILRAALPSVITLVGLAFAQVLAGAVLIEEIFAWPGLGQYAYQSAVTLDLPAIMGVSLFIACVYVTINFIVDVLYGVIDPRLRIA